MQLVILASFPFVHLVSQLLQEATQSLQASIQALYFASINSAFTLFLFMPFETDGMVDAAIVINASATNNKVTFFIKYFVLVVNEFSLGKCELLSTREYYTTL
jgi:hypothetical protein